MVDLAITAMGLSPKVEVLPVEIKRAGNSYTIDTVAELKKIYPDANFTLVLGSDAANNFAPKVIARYCHDLAVSFNSFYEHVKVLDSDNNALKSSRICLVHSFQSVVVWQHQKC